MVDKATYSGKYYEQHYELKLKRIVAQILADNALLMEVDRFKRVADTRMVKWLVTIATQEEPLCRYPATWWDAFKEKWLKRWFTVNYTEVIAVHKYPELSIPDQVLGREFVHLRIKEEDEKL